MRIEEEHHRRVPRDALQDRPVVVERVSADEVVLALHQVRATDLRVGRGQQPVPEQDHLLLERAPAPEHAQHPAPLGVVQLRGVEVEEEQLLVDVVRHRFVVDQPIDRAGEPERAVLGQLLG